MPVEISVPTEKRNELVDITPQLRAYIDKKRIRDGILTVFIPHTTAGVTLNENADPTVKSDVMGFLEKMVPKSSSFNHAEGNSDSHIKCSLVSSSASIIIEAGDLQLGTWQGVFLAEFDGPRTRKVWVKVLS